MQSKGIGSRATLEEGMAACREPRKGLFVKRREPSNKALQRTGLRPAAERQVVSRTRHMGAIERVVSRWRADGIGPNPGAAPAMIDRLVQQVGTPLPDDVRSFYALADGIEDGYPDDYLLYFWPIEKVISETAELRRRNYPMDPRDTPIADFLINSWFVFLRRFGEGRVGVWVEGAALEFPSLTAFFDRYEADPESLGLLVDQTGTPRNQEAG